MHNFQRARLACLSLIGAFLLAGCGGGDEASNFTLKGAGSPTATSRLSPFGQSLLAGSPTSFKVTMFAAYISANEDCSSPTQVADFGQAGEEFDLFSNPTIFSANLPEGSYSCLILEFQDTMKFTADDDAVAAHTGCTDTSTEYTFDVYRDGDNDDEAWVDLSGDPIDATGSAASPGGDHVTSFASTAADASVVDASGVTVNENQFITLASPLVVPGQTTLYFEASNSLTDHEEDGQNYCWVEQLTMGFE